MVRRMHGGPDGGPPLHWDFSVNSNAAGPCPMALAAVRCADREHYPDPTYTRLRQALARFHGVAPWRVVVGGSASELILRISQRAVRRGVRQAWWPERSYGDYAHAARVAGLSRAPQPTQAGLMWCCEPSSPTGQDEPMLRQTRRLHGQVVLDAAYEPLRLSGASALLAVDRDALWQLWTPNKALGLTGVRAAYALAPADGRDEADALDEAAPSWVLGGEGVALLTAWTHPAVQDWVAGSRQRLADWKHRQLRWLAERGWQVLPSHTPFFCVRPPQPLDAVALRSAGIGLRDATSFGLPGWWRMAVLPPAATAALATALGFRALECPA